MAAIPFPTHGAKRMKQGLPPVATPAPLAWHHRDIPGIPVMRINFSPSNVIVVLTNERKKSHYLVAAIIYIYISSRKARHETI